MSRSSSATRKPQVATKGATKAIPLPPGSDWRPWGIGGSDIGAILGLSPYRSAIDVWLDKLGRRRNENSAVHLRYGHHLEPFVAKEYERETGHTTHAYPHTIRHPVHSHLFAHVDRLVCVDGQGVVDEAGEVTTKVLLECKTASAFTSSQWGTPWTDEIPATYVAQCVWYMALTGCDEAHVAVLLGNSDFRVYRVLRDNQLAGALISAALQFWDQHVLSGDPPPARAREDVEQLFPEHVEGKDVEADAELLGHIRKLQRLTRISKRIEARAADLSARVTSRMRDAERVCVDGRPLATWRSAAPVRRVDVARLRREQPEVVSRYISEGTPSRRFTLVGGRDEYTGS
jgi:putative phage-type endonuclease